LFEPLPTSVGPMSWPVAMHKEKERK